MSIDGEEWQLKSVPLLEKALGELDLSILKYSVLVLDDKMLVALRDWMWTSVRSAREIGPDPSAVAFAKAMLRATRA